MKSIETLYATLLKYSGGDKEMMIRVARKVIEKNISPEVVSDYQAVIEMAQQ